MLAALTVLLMAEKLHNSLSARVVYIPDCAALLTDAVSRVQWAMVAAFADDAAQCEEIRKYTEDELIRFSGRHPHSMIFILDHFEALLMGPATKEPSGARRATALMDACTEWQFRVQAVSVNDENKDDVKKGRISVQPWELKGGLTPVSPHLAMQGSWMIAVLPLY